MSKQCFNVIERNAYTGSVKAVTCNLTEEEAQSLARKIVDEIVAYDVQQIVDASVKHNGKHSVHYVSAERLAEIETEAWECVEVVNDRRHASWVVVKNDTGEAVVEISNAERVSKKLNRDLYSLVPIYEYLTKLNARIARGEA